jgi:hypothetical protein
MCMLFSYSSVFCYRDLSQEPPMSEKSLFATRMHYLYVDPKILSLLLSECILKSNVEFFIGKRNGCPLPCPPTRWELSLPSWTRCACGSATTLASWSEVMGSTGRSLMLTSGCYKMKKIVKSHLRDILYIYSWDETAKS